MFHDREQLDVREPEPGDVGGEPLAGTSTSRNRPLLSRSAFTIEVMPGGSAPSPGKGAIAIGMSYEEQLRLRSIVITHSHLDHVISLPLFIVDLFDGSTPVDMVMLVEELKRRRELEAVRLGGLLHLAHHPVNRLDGASLQERDRGLLKSRGVRTEGLEPEKTDGWQVHSVQNWEDLIAFARAFSQAHYTEKQGGRGRPRA